MAITSLDDYIAAQKQLVHLYRIGNRPVVANYWYSLMGLNGVPSPGVLAGSNTANGVLETDAIAGYPNIRAFPTSGKGYVTRVSACNNYVCRLRLYDVLVKAGAYSYNANVSLTSQPSISSRLPLDLSSNPCYDQVELWYECVTAITGSGMTVTVTYTDQDGNTGATTGAYQVGATPVARLIQLPLAAGDVGVRKIESVAGAVGTAGTFNILLMRPICEVRVNSANQMSLLGLDATGFAEVFADSALTMILSGDSTSSGTLDAFVEIASY